MVKKNTKTNQTQDLALQISKLEGLVTILAEIAKTSTRKKRLYTDEQRAAIRARLLAGQEAARKRKEVEVTTAIAVKSGSIKKVNPRKVAKVEKKPEPKALMEQSKS